MDTVAQAWREDVFAWEPDGGGGAGERLRRQQSVVRSYGGGSSGAVRAATVALSRVTYDRAAAPATCFLLPLLDTWPLGAPVVGVFQGMVALPVPVSWAAQQQRGAPEAWAANVTVQLGGGEVQVYLGLASVDGGGGGGGGGVRVTVPGTTAAAPCSSAEEWEPLAVHYPALRTQWTVVQWASTCAALSAAAADLQPPTALDSDPHTGWDALWDVQASTGLECTALS